MHSAQQELMLRMPFPAGTTVLCTQGSYSPRPNSHSGPLCLHALDFTATSESVCAAAKGVVSLIVASHDEGNRTGFGLQVGIDHGNDILSVYSHLSAIHVVVNQEVDSGTQIGLMGATGRTGGFPHLHFSLNEKLSPSSAVGDTLFMHSLVCANMSKSPSIFGVHDSDKFSGILGDQPKGHMFFGSENASGHDALIGPCTGGLRLALEESKNQLVKAMSNGTFPFTEIEASAEACFVDEEQHFAALESAANENPDDLIAKFYLASALTRRPGRLLQAKELFSAIIDKAPESWVLPWSQYNVGEILAAEGHMTEAIECFEKTLDANLSRNFREVVSRRLNALGASSPGH